MRNELEKSSANNTPPRKTSLNNETQQTTQILEGIESRNLLSSSPQNAILINTGASPKVKKSPPSLQSTPIKNGKKKWNPPLLGPLPPGFLRLSNVDPVRTDFDLPDEQFALMLQNEEFMNELRWNQEFMSALEREQQEKGKTEDDAAFKERLKHMGKVSRKKFLQMARVFTWQRKAKPSSVRHPDSLLLQEEPSDDEDLKTKK